MSTTEPTEDTASARSGPVAPEPTEADAAEQYRRWNPRRLVAPWPVAPLALLFGLNAVDELDRVAFGVLLPEIRDAFGLSLGGVTLLIAITVPVGLLLELPVAWAADRWNRSRMAAGGAFIWAGFCLLTGLAPTVVVLGLARVGSSVGKLMNATHNSLLADHYPAETRGRAFYTHRFANSLGQFTAPLIAGVLAAVFTWRTPFVVLAVPSAVLAVTALLFLREPVRGFHERRAAGADESVASLEEEPAGFREAVSTLMRMPTPRRVYLAAPFIAAAQLGMAPLLALFYDEVYDVGPVGRGIISASTEPVQLVGLFIGVVVMHRRIQADPSSGVRVIGGAFALSGVMIAAMAMSPWIGVAIAAQLVNAAIFGLVLPAVPVIASLVVPPRMRTQGFAVINLFLFPGILALPLGGVMGDLLGLRAGVLVFVPILMLGGLMVASAGKTINADIEAVQQAARDAVANGRPEPTAN